MRKVCGCTPSHLPAVAEAAASTGGLEAACWCRLGAGDAEDGNLRGRHSLARMSVERQAMGSTVRHSSRHSPRFGYKILTPIKSQGIPSIVEEWYSIRMTVPAAPPAAVAALVTRSSACVSCWRRSRSVRCLIFEVRYVKHMSLLRLTAKT